MQPAQVQLQAKLDSHVCGVREVLPTQVPTPLVCWVYPLPPPLLLLVLHPLVHIKWPGYEQH